jgi:hypothetical protein
VASGQAASIGDAIDAVIERLRQLENRHRLPSATERYFDQLEPNAASEENSLAHALATAAI